jgi:hypothetical protein
MGALAVLRRLLKPDDDYIHVGVPSWHCMALAVEKRTRLHLWSEQDTYLESVSTLWPRCNYTSIAKLNASKIRRLAADIGAKSSNTIVRIDPEDPTSFSIAPFQHLLKTLKRIVILLHLPGTPTEEAYLRALPALEQAAGSGFLPRRINLDHTLAPYGIFKDEKPHDYVLARREYWPKVEKRLI